MKLKKLIKEVRLKNNYNFGKENLILFQSNLFIIRKDCDKKCQKCI